MTIAEGPRHTIVLLALYSERYPAIGESHGLSVVAGSLASSFSSDVLGIHVLDMVEWGEEECTRAVELIRRTGADSLAIGLSYGTFSSLEKQYRKMRSALRGPRPLVVFEARSRLI
jgi:hypothetical protein